MAWIVEMIVPCRDEDGNPRFVEFCCEAPYLRALTAADAHWPVKRLIRLTDGRIVTPLSLENREFRIEGTNEMLYRT